MKYKQLLTMTLAAALIFSSCGGDQTTEDTDTAETDTTELSYDDMNEIALKDYELDMSIMLPEVASSTGNAIEPEILHDEGDYLWYVNIGPRFQMIIEDVAKRSDAVAKEKARLQGLSDIFEIEFIVDEPKVLMYKRSLHEGEGGKPTYHCYGAAQVDGYTYVLRSHEDGSLKPIINDMTQTIRSAGPIKEGA